MSVLDTHVRFRLVTAPERLTRVAVVGGPEGLAALPYALGRLDEAAEPMRLSLEKFLAHEYWKNASVIAGNLSELHLAPVAIRDAEAAARQSVELADRSGEWIERRDNRTTLAEALHQAARIGEAHALFAEAEALQKARQPASPLLSSLRGFRYCDLLLGQGQPEDVLDRACRTLAWVTPQNWLLAVALDHLSLGRAHVAQARRGRTSVPAHVFASVRAHLTEAVTGFRQTGQQHHLPLGLPPVPSCTSQRTTFPLPSATSTRLS